MYLERAFQRYYLKSSCRGFSGALMGDPLLEDLVGVHDNRNHQSPFLQKPSVSGESQEVRYHCGKFNWQSKLLRSCWAQQFLKGNHLLLGVSPRRACLVTYLHNNQYITGTRLKRHGLHIQQRPFTLNCMHWYK